MGLNDETTSKMHIPERYQGWKPGEADFFRQHNNNQRLTGNLKINPFFDISAFQLSTFTVIITNYTGSEDIRAGNQRGNMAPSVAAPSTNFQY